MTHPLRSSADRRTKRRSAPRHSTLIPSWLPGQKRVDLPCGRIERVFGRLPSVPGLDDLIHQGRLDLRTSGNEGLSTGVLQLRYVDATEMIVERFGVIFDVIESTGQRTDRFNQVIAHARRPLARLSLSR